MELLLIRLLKNIKFVFVRGSHRCSRFSVAHGST